MDILDFGKIFGIVEDSGWDTSFEEELVKALLTISSKDWSKAVRELYFQFGSQVPHQVIHCLFEALGQDERLLEVIEELYVKSAVPIVNARIAAIISGLKGAELCAYLCKLFASRREYKDGVNRTKRTPEIDDVNYLLVSGLVGFIPRRDIAILAGEVKSADIRAVLLGESVKRLAKSRSRNVDVGVETWKQALKVAIYEEPGGNATRMAMQLAFGRNTRRFADREFVYNMLSDMLYRSPPQSKGYRNFVELYASYMNQESIDEQDKHWLTCNIEDTLSHIIGVYRGVIKQVKDADPLRLR